MTIDTEVLNSASSGLSGMDAGDLFPRHTRPVGRRAGQGAVTDSVDPVLDLAPFLIRWRGAQNLQVAVDLRAVGVDDHAMDLLSKGEGQRRLAGCGRPGDED